LKSRKPTRRNPARKEPKSSSDLVLTLLTDKDAKLRRRYLMAKDQLKVGLHVPECLAVLRQVLNSRWMNPRQKDHALRLLSKHDRKGAATGRPIMLLPVSYRDLAGCVEGPVEWIPDEQWDSMCADGKKRWLPTGFAIKNDGESDDEG
jgi:hypothetical protein